MKFTVLFSLPWLLVLSFQAQAQHKVFDVHLHGSPHAAKQVETLQRAGVYKTAISTSWKAQQEYMSTQSVGVLRGLMLPCPNGKVPYSLQPCFDDGKEWPSIQWVEQQIKNGKIDFIGEILSQYHGISSSDSMLMPYYKLAEKYKLPVGIHTGSAGPDHGCPNFSESMGNPKLMEQLLSTYPTLKVWIMHAGAPFVPETIEIMKKYRDVYMDISAVNNPAILPADKFSALMKLFIDNGLEDRIMFGSDNGNIDVTINAITSLSFLSKEQQEKIFFKNAETFFQKK
jgi:predicted metal-dependent TIM-barrel fold hydrolase